MKSIKEISKILSDSKTVILNCLTNPECHGTKYKDKKLNLDRPDGYQFCWLCIESEEEIVIFHIWQGEV